MKQAILTMCLCALSCVPAFGDGDIALDYTEESLSASDRKASVESMLSAEDSAKAEAMALFCDAVLRSVGKNRLDDKGFDELFKALEKDPSSFELIRIIIAESQKAGRLRVDADRLWEESKKNPGNFQLALQAGFVMEQLGRRSDEIKILESCVLPAVRSGLSASGDSPEGFDAALSRLCMLYVESEESGKAADIFDKISDDGKKLPESPELLRAGLVSYSAALDGSSDTSPYCLWFLSSEKERCKGKLNACLDAFEKAVDGGHLNASMYGPALDVMNKEGRTIAVRRLLFMNLIDFPEDVSSLVRLANFFLDAGEPFNAVRVWRQVFKAGAKVPAEFYVAYGLALRRAGELEDAVNAYKWALLMQPSNEGAMYQLATVLFEMKQPGKALARLGKMKSGAEVDYLKALCYNQAKKYSEALQALLECEAHAEGEFKRNVDDRNFRLFFGSVAEKACRPDLIESHLKPLIEADPKDAEVLNFIGYTFADMNVKLDEAEGYLRRAVAIDPSNPAILDSMAWVFYRKGKYKEALEWMEKSLAASEGMPDPVIADHAGDIHRALGDIKGALKLWGMALHTWSDETDTDKIAAKIKENGGDPSKDTFE